MCDKIVDKPLRLCHKTMSISYVKSEAEAEGKSAHEKKWNIREWAME